jgi:Calx-beta domain
MNPARTILLSACALVPVVTAAAAAHAAPGPARPVIGKPATAPTHPLAGKPFTVSFRVTRSDNRAPLTGGKMTAAATIAGKAVRHSDSLRRGVVRLSLVVPPGATGKRLQVKLTVRLGARSATRTAVFGIQRSAPPPVLSVSDASVAEGNAGTATLSFEVGLSAASAQPVTVRYATVDGTAIAPGDYAASSGTLTFAPSARLRTIAVAVVGDTAAEEDETLTITLTGPTGAKLARATATGTITNDDAAPRSGRYTGPTSQGRPVSFDVAPDRASVSNVDLQVDMACTEVPLTLLDVDFGTAPGAWTPLGADGSFAVDGQGTDSDGTTYTIAFHGALVAPGSGSGTLRIDMALPVPGVGTVHCSSGDLTWTAS